METIFTHSHPNGVYLIHASSLEEAFEIVKKSFDYADYVEEQGKEKVDQDIYDSITEFPISFKDKIKFDGEI